MILAPEGRLAIITFHSLEDREVKNLMYYCSGRKKRFDTNDEESELTVQETDNGLSQSIKRISFDEAQRQTNLFLPSFRLVSAIGKSEGSGGGKWTIPSDEEIQKNPRARSARLRVAERTKFPPLQPYGRRQKSDAP